MNQNFRVVSYFFASKHFVAHFANEVVVVFSQRAGELHWAISTAFQLIGLPCSQPLWLIGVWGREQTPVCLWLITWQDPNLLLSISLNFFCTPRGRKPLGLSSWDQGLMEVLDCLFVGKIQELSCQWPNKFLTTYGGVKKLLVWNLWESLGASVTLLCIFTILDLNNVAT